MVRRDILVALSCLLCVVAGAEVVVTKSDAPPIWEVENSFGNVTCLMAQMNVRANFSYQRNDENKTKTNVSFDIPANAVTDKNASSCSDTKDVLNVKWDTGNFELIFEGDNKTYDLSSFTITLNASSMYNDSDVDQIIMIAYSHNDTFKVPSNFSYHCNHEQILNVTTDPKDVKFIQLSKVQFEAFKVDNKKTFSLAKDCDSNVKPDIVPIAVGLSLIALIIIVLIAFIVGRRRSQARGYLNIM